MREHKSACGRETRYGCIYWILAGPKSMASSRLHGYTIHDYCVANGLSSVILYNPPARITELPLKALHFNDPRIFRNNDIVVFQKMQGPAVLSAIERLRARGLRVVYIDCDYPPKVAEASRSSLVICTSERLAQLYRARGITQVVVQKEAYEYAPRAIAMRNTGAPVTCVWFGSMDAAKLADWEWVQELLRRRFPRYRLVTISQFPQHDVRWDLATSWGVISSCDIAILPSGDYVAAQCKSPNKAIQAMALGLPVIAYPIPSYAEVIKHGRNGYLCHGEEEWTTALSELGSAAVRARVGRLGRRFATRYFRMSIVGQEWVRALWGDNNCSTKASRSHPSTPACQLRLLRVVAYIRLALTASKRVWVPLALARVMLKQAVGEIFRRSK